MGSMDRRRCGRTDMRRGRWRSLRCAMGRGVGWKRVRRFLMRRGEISKGGGQGTVTSEEGRGFGKIRGRYSERETERICRPSGAYVVWALSSQRLRAGL